MQEQYFCLSTTKDLNEIERILRKLRMEVILRTDHLNLKFEDLSAEERMAFLDSLEKEMKIRLKRSKRYAEDFYELQNVSKQYAEKLFRLIKSYRVNPSKDIVTAITRLGDKASESQYNKRFTNLHKYGSVYYLAPSFHGVSGVSGSCLIAKKGENTVRYLSVRNDPTIIICGPASKNIKQKLRQMLST